MLTHLDLNDSLRAQLATNAGELALTLAPTTRLRFKCDFGGEDHGREAGWIMQHNTQLHCKH